MGLGILRGGQGSSRSDDKPSRRRSARLRLQSCGRNRQTFEGGNGVGAHDLRRNEEVKAVDEAGGEEGGVEARAGFSEESEDAFFAEFVEHFFERTRPASAEGPRRGRRGSQARGCAIRRGRR